jgi:hypothetical protein
MGMPSPKNENAPRVLGERFQNPGCIQAVSLVQSAGRASRSRVVCKSRSPKAGAVTEGPGRRVSCNNDTRCDASPAGPGGASYLFIH